MELIGKIDAITKTVNNQNDLIEYELESFNINDCSSSCIIKSLEGNISISKWVSPKRTRSEPFARVYKTIGQMKSITVIPVIKDEGAAGDCDYFNPTTLAWMNLLNIYIILVPYVKADINPRNNRKITNQKFDNKIVKKQIENILKFRSDAHHYNNANMKENFVEIYNKAIRFYDEIGKDNHVIMNTKKKLESTTFQEYLILKNESSIRAAKREKLTSHELEFTFYDKAIIEITNFYEGKYFLTIDEVYKEGDKLVLREAKNSTSTFPSEGEMLDAFFKSLLFVNIDRLILKTEGQNKEFKAIVEIIFTGNSVKTECIFQQGDSKTYVETKIKKSVVGLTSNRIEKISKLIYQYVNNTGCRIRVGENDND